MLREVRTLSERETIRNKFSVIAAGDILAKLIVDQDIADGEEEAARKILETSVRELLEHYDLATIHTDAPGQLVVGHRLSTAELPEDVQERLREEQRMASVAGVKGPLDDIGMLGQNGPHTCH